RGAVAVFGLYGGRAHKRPRRPGELGAFRLAWRPPTIVLRSRSERWAIPQPPPRGPLPPRRRQPAPRSHPRRRRRHDPFLFPLPQRILRGDVLLGGSAEQAELVLLHERVVAEVDLEAGLALEAAHEIGFVLQDVEGDAGVDADGELAF